ncbi:MAG: hypothetical protein SNF33_05435 [Candidatus Algichlamydia australiensis]|nr:hypothetical protein [Chlamydiales bacterium]
MAETSLIPSFSSHRLPPSIYGNGNSTAIEYIKNISIEKGAPDLQLRVAAIDSKPPSSSLISKISYVAGTTIVYALFLKYTAPYFPVSSPIEIGGYIGGNVLCTLAFVLIPVGKVIDTILGREVDTTIANFTTNAENLDEVTLFCDKERLKHSFLKEHRVEILNKYLDHEIHHNLQEKIIRVALSVLSFIGAVYLFQSSLIFLGTTRRTLTYIAGEQLLSSIGNYFTYGLISKEYSGKASPETLVSLEDFLPHAHQLYSWEKERRVEILKKIVHEMGDKINQDLGKTEPADLHKIRNIHLQMNKEREESSFALLLKAEDLAANPQKKEDIQTLLSTLKEVAKAIPSSTPILQTWIESASGVESQKHLQKIVQELKQIRKSIHKLKQKHSSYKNIQALSEEFSTEKRAYLKRSDLTTARVQGVWKQVAFGVKTLLMVLAYIKKMKNLIETVSWGIKTLLMALAPTEKMKNLIEMIDVEALFENLENHMCQIPKGDKEGSWKEWLDDALSGYFQQTVTDLGEHFI